MDDASSDTTEAVGSRLAAADARVEYRRHTVNRGHIATYNEALAMLTGEFCMLLSADDLLMPGALRRATRVMVAHPEVGLTYGPDITFRHAPPAGDGARDRSSARTGSCRTSNSSSARAASGTRRFRRRPWSCGRRCTAKIGDYLPQLPHTADTEIWLRMAAHSAVCELHAPQAFRRLHAKNMSLDYSPARRLDEQRKAFDTHFDQFRSTHPEIAGVGADRHPHDRRAGVLERGQRVRRRRRRRPAEIFLTFAAAHLPRDRVVGGVAALAREAVDRPVAVAASGAGDVAREGAA